MGHARCSSMFLWDSFCWSVYCLHVLWEPRLSHHSAQPDPASHKLRTWPYLTWNSVWGVRLTWAVAGGPWFKIKSKWVKLIHICLCGPRQWHMLNETFKMHLVTQLLVLKPVKAIINSQVLENLIHSIYLWPYRSGFLFPFYAEMIHTNLFALWNSSTTVKFL